MKTLNMKIASITKHLTKRLKIKNLSILPIRDHGFRCFYCNKDLDLKSCIHEHLNNDPHDNRIENIVLACQSCNNKKPYDSSMQEKAIQKLKQNQASNFMRERKISKEDLTQEASKEIDINVSNYEIVEQDISERIKTDGYVVYKETVNSCTYLCKEKTQHGSQQCVRNYIAALTSEVGSFEIIRDNNKKKIIVVRKGK